MGEGKKAFSPSQTFTSEICDSQRISCRSIKAATDVPPIRETAESNRAAGRTRAAGRLDRVLLALRPPGEMAVCHLDGDRAVPGDARRDHPLVLRPHCHARGQGRAFRLPY